MKIYFLWMTNAGSYSKYYDGWQVKLKANAFDVLCLFF